jgi:hypothetical protein
MFRRVPSILCYLDRDGKDKAKLTIWKCLIASVLLCCCALGNSGASWLVVPFAHEQTGPAVFSASNEHDEISICFITSQYGTDASKTDHVVDVRQVVPKLWALSHPHLAGTPTPRVRFFAYTNLPDLVAPGWEILVREFPQYKRLITRSRWPKFQAFRDPVIRSTCEVVYYMDGVMTPLNHVVPFQKQAERILHQASLEVVGGSDSNSKTALLKDGAIGLAQKLHYPPEPKRGRHYGRVQNDTSSTSNAPSNALALGYTLREELKRIVQLRKDTEENVQKLQGWLESQPDFSWDCPMMYANHAFGYAVNSTKFQEAADFLWEHYSKEEDSVSTPHISNTSWMNVMNGLRW